MCEQDHEFAGTPAYEPPEMHSKDRPVYSIKQEYWKIGLVMANNFSTIGNIANYHLLKEWDAPVIASDVNNAFPDLYPDNETLNTIKVNDMCLYTYIKFIHSLCHKEVQWRPILNDYGKKINELKNLVFPNQKSISFALSESDSLSDTISFTFTEPESTSDPISKSKTKKNNKYAIPKWISFRDSGSYDNLTVSSRNSPTSSTETSPNVSPCTTPKRKLSISSNTPKRKNSVNNSPSPTPINKNTGRKLVPTRSRSASEAIDMTRNDERTKIELLRKEINMEGTCRLGKSPDLFKKTS
jgi:hypothetical protein